MSDKRFYGNSLRCPDTPFFIEDNITGDTVLKFKHDELPYGSDSLNKIITLLNELDDTIVLLKNDLDESRKDDDGFEYNITKLTYIREEYKDKLKDYKRQYYDLRSDYDDLVKENLELKEKMKCLEKLNEQYYNYYNMYFTELCDYKVLVKDVLQENYDYADKQKKEYIDDVVIYNAYDLLATTIYAISDELDNMIKRKGE